MPRPAWLSIFTRPIHITGRRAARRRAGYSSGAAASATDPRLNEPPDPLDDAPVPLDPATLARVGARVVLIERLDARGRHAGPACAFIDSRGWVVTNRHCILGAASVRLNLGVLGMFDLPTLRADSEDLDVVALSGDFPAPPRPPLAWNERPPRLHAPVSVVVRSSSGELRESPGRAGGVTFGRYDELALQTSAPAWMGCSGSPLVDRDGAVVGVVCKLGHARPAQHRPTAGASLTADVLALPALDTPLATWPAGGGDATRVKYYNCERTAMDLAYRDPAYALSYARAALKLRPRDLRPAAVASWLLDRTGRSDEGTALLVALAKRARDDWRPELLMGHRAYSAGRYTDAIAHYERSLRIEPHAATWFWLGCAQWWKRDFPAAIRSLEASAKLEPCADKTWDHLARLYALTNQPREEVRIAQHRLDTDPTDAEALATLASAQLRAGLASEHQSTLTTLRATNPYLANRAALPPADWSDVLDPKIALPD